MCVCVFLIGHNENVLETKQHNKPYKRKNHETKVIDQIHKEMYSIDIYYLKTYATATFVVCCWCYIGGNRLPVVHRYSLQNIDVQDYLVAIGKDSGGK